MKKFLLPPLAVIAMIVSSALAQNGTAVVDFTQSATSVNSGQTFTVTFQLQSGVNPTLAAVSSFDLFLESNSANVDNNFSIVLPVTYPAAGTQSGNPSYPDTISSDVHALCINGPAFDQVTTLSKFLCMGMPLPDVIAASTVKTATALKRPELGTLKTGGIGDATILSIREGQFDYVDAVGEHMTGDRRIVSEGVVIAGRWWHPQDRTKLHAAAS